MSNHHNHWVHYQTKIECECGMMISKGMMGKHQGGKAHETQMTELKSLDYHRKMDNLPEVKARKPNKNLSLGILD